MANAYYVSILTAIVTVIVIGIGLYTAYATGMFDGMEKTLALYWMKGKAKAQEKRLESLGKVEGVDFDKAELPGNKQAEDVMQNGVEGIGGLADGIGGVGKGIGGGLGL